ncbi:MAG: hypothetical protein KF723_09765 [Rhizobiaceae bacterium]|nr:hypothetical protein [Rhizobiaceae bacterium]
MSEEIPWEAQCHAVAATFARRCRELYDQNPYDEAPLESVINTFMTELWDSGFSQSEIAKAFEDAILDMLRYAAGKERRGDKP